MPAELASASALLALWNDVAAESEPAYNAWHAVEHVPERLTVPGIVWARRFANPAASGQEARAPRYLTLYGLRDAAVLQSEPYQRLLREPTPMSRTMRPLLRHVSRWVCRLDLALGDPPHTPWLLVQTASAEADAPPAGEWPGVLASLSGERLHDAQPLPWLAAGQTGGADGRADGRAGGRTGGGAGGGVEGERLRVLWLADRPAVSSLPRASALYRRLPVGGSAA